MTWAGPEKMNQKCSVNELDRCTYQDETVVEGVLRRELEKKVV